MNDLIHQADILKERAVLIKVMAKTFMKLWRSLRLLGILTKTVEPLKLPYSTGNATCAGTTSRKNASLF